ncbi:hypothetical protein [Formosa haliotis]|uniref:hypothetical protein n=1 Tax=Formosa haliotis TaxID=1555194 RepID=UPI00135646E4|nr:hypothetical protein [Formosa haliotis]
MNRQQGIGIAIIILGICLGYFFKDNDIWSTIGGGLSAIGLALVLKLFTPKMKQN